MKTSLVIVKAEDCELDQFMKLSQIAAFMDSPVGAQLRDMLRVNYPDVLTRAGGYDDE